MRYVFVTKSIITHACQGVVGEHELQPIPPEVREQIEQEEALQIRPTRYWRCSECDSWYFNLRGRGRKGRKG